MILDRLEQADMYRPLGAAIALALDYLRETDFSRVSDGRHELDGDRVYAMISRYRPKPLAEAFWESHRRYLDVQYVTQGVERVGYAPLRDGLTVRQAYDSQKDLVVYDAVGEFFTLRPGDFAIFAPHDVHAPGLALDPPEDAGEVRKVVVKCRVG
jgi:YhcH/YjgK/YiaL family protein